MENSDGYFSHHLIGRRAHTRLGVEDHVGKPTSIDGSWKNVFDLDFFLWSRQVMFFVHFVLCVLFFCLFRSFMFLSMSWHGDIRDSFEHLNI